GLAALDAALGALLFCTGHYREALAAAERAAVFARAVGDRKLLATAAERSAWALLHMGGRTEDHLHHPGGALSEGGAGRAPRARALIRTPCVLEHAPDCARADRRQALPAQPPLQRA